MKPQTPTKPILNSAQLLATFPAGLQQMLRSGKAQGATGTVDFVGGSTLNNLFSLHGLYSAVGAAGFAASTLEIGMACGTSAALLAHLHRTRGEAGAHQHVAIDPFQHELDEAGVTLLHGEELQDFVQLIREPSYIALPALLQAGRQFDLIYVDGSHHFEDVMIDFIYSLHLLTDGGIMAFDDSTWTDVAKVLRFVERNYADIVEPVDVLAHRPADTISLKTRVAAALKRNQMTAFRKVGMPTRHWSAKFVNF
jgi:predicted O-methyltransferase YrrM